MERAPNSYYRAAFIQIGEKKFSIIQGNQDLYRKIESENIIRGAPLLISEGILVGRYFVKSGAMENESLPGEHPDRHQAGFGPGMAFATTPDNHLILLAVDGRSP
jgi:hypothetical protein